MEEEVIPEEYKHYAEIVPGWKERYLQYLNWSKEKLAAELALLECQVEALDPQTKWIVRHIYTPVCLVTLRGFAEPGVLLGAVFDLKRVMMYFRREREDYYTKEKEVEESIDWVDKAQFRTIRAILEQYRIPPEKKEGEE